MSYILDALRKSDQQRQRGAPPTLLAPQGAVVEPGRRVSASHVLAAAILVGAGVVVGVLRPWQSERPLAPTEPAAIEPIESGPRAPPEHVRAPTTRKSVRDVPAQKTASAARSATPRAAAKRENRAKTPRKPREAVAAAPTKVAKPASEKPDAASAGDSEQDKNVMTIAELPLSVRQDIPKLSISVHAYSREPAKRLVGINDRMLHEGDSVAPGLVLERITPDGMIMSYKGYRFRRGVR